MAWLFGRRGRRKGDAVERHPVDSQGRPDLKTFHRHAEAYARLHLEGISTFDFHKRVEGHWGLIAKGHESVPYLVDLLRHPDPEARADGAWALASVGATDRSIQLSLINVLQSADTHEERDTLLLALGHMRSKDAIPVIARLIRSGSTDGDTRTMAVQALGKIARRRFDKRPDPLAAAVEYLDRIGA